MAKKNYYAVKIGHNVGIYKTWDECRKNVEGYSGARFKGFATYEEAEYYLTGKKPQIKSLENSDIAIAYVDGSFNSKTGYYGCGIVLIYNGIEHYFKYSFNDELGAAMHNVSGELEGAKMAMRYCLENGIKGLHLYYDYDGIEKWCTGAWKTKKIGTMAYKKYYKQVSKKVKVAFFKVKGHSGDKYNELADFLEKEDCGII